MGREGHHRLTPEEFTTFADYLDRYTTGGLARVDKRVEKAKKALEAGGGVKDCWWGENATTFTDGMAKLAPVVQSVEPECADAYRAVRDLIKEARKVAEVIREVEWAEKSWNQQFVSNWSEWQDRTLTAAAAMVPWADDGADARSAAKTAEWQELTRRTEEMSERRDVALKGWADKCGIAKDKLKQVASKLDGLLKEPFPELAQPERGYHPDAARRDVQLSWMRLVDRVVQDRKGDPTQLQAWWLGLTVEERQVIMRRRPDLVRNELWAFLTEEERRMFLASDTYTTREVKQVATVEGETPVITVRLTAEASVSKKLTSDDKVEVTIELSGEAALGVGLGRFGSIDAGRRRKLVVTYEFASAIEADAAVEELRAALNHDAFEWRSGTPQTLSVLAERFGYDKAAIEDSDSGLVKLATDVGFAGVETKIVAGSFTNHAKGEKGLLFETSVKGYASRGPSQATAELGIEGRVLVKDDGRRYLRYTAKGELSASGELFSSLGLGDQDIAGIPLPASTSGLVTVSGEVEITEENLPEVATFVTNLGTQRLDPANVIDLHRASDVTVTTATGTHVILRAPSNPIGGAELSTQEANTAGAHRKTPEGTYYSQKNP